jgi:hypothetical protein
MEGWINGMMVEKIINPIFQYSNIPLFEMSLYYAKA